MVIQNSIKFDTSHSGIIHDCQFDYYAKTLATASSDFSIRLWDVSSDQIIFITELLGHEGPVWHLSWSHPKFGNLLASCSYDRRIFIWKEQASRQWTLIFKNEDHTSSVNTVSFGVWEIGLHLAAASSDGSISVLSYEQENGSWKRKVFSAHPNGVLCLSWDATTSYFGTTNASSQQNKFQRRLVSGGCDFQIRVWVYNESNDEWFCAQSLNVDKNVTSWIRDVAWRPHIGSHNIIASCSDDGNVILWMETENHSWKAKQVLDLKEPVWKVSWSVTGTVFSATSGVNQLTLFKENLFGVWEPIDPSTTKTDLSNKIEDSLKAPEQLAQTNFSEQPLYN